MTAAAALFLPPAEAARRLGVSAKALRLYEQRGLLRPSRTQAGWRAYGPREMARGAEIAGLRALGLSLAQVERVLGGDAEVLMPALAAHEAALQAHMRQLGGTLDKVRHVRAGLARGTLPTGEELAGLVASEEASGVRFALPWPWDGECFVLGRPRPLNYIVGPLGSGKTRLAMQLAEVLPGARFLGLARIEDGAARTRLEADPALRARVAQVCDALAAKGATPSAALTALLAALEDEGVGAWVVDLVEEGLDEATQHALSAYLGRRGTAERPLFVMTRSSAILDLAAVEPDASILLCPANHSPPAFVTPCAGAPGYEAVASCLAPPAVRARTRGMVARMAQLGSARRD